MSCYKLKTVEQLCCLPTLQKKGGATFTRAHQKEDQMIKFDLKDAFFTVSIEAQSQHLLHFINGGTRYQFWCLPFDLGPPPPFYLPSFKTNCNLPMKTVVLKKVLHCRGLQQHLETAE